MFEKQTYLLSHELVGLLVRNGIFETFFMAIAVAVINACIIATNPPFLE